MNLIAAMGIVEFFNTIMWPFRAVVSGLLVLFHRVWAPLFGSDSGITWVLSIVLLVVVVRLLIIPLFIKQMKSSRAMQTLQPKLKALQKKYAGDRERLGRETMELYRSEGANPMSSCLPLLCQIPVFFALFQVLNAASRGNYNDSLGYFFQKNPGLVDSLRGSQVFGAKLANTFIPASPFGATQVLCIVLVLLMCTSLFIQQFMMLNRNTPPAALEGPMGKNQKMILYVFPVVYLFTGVSVPIGVLVYWLTTNLWTLGQQTILIRYMPTPDTPAYVEWEERMRAKGLDPREIEREQAQARREKAAAKKAKRTGMPVKPITDEDVQNMIGEAKNVGRVQPRAKSRAQRKSKPDNRK